jgi:hypothetical protein
MMVVRFPAITLVLAVFFRCTQLGGGAGGETTNGLVTGQLTNNDGLYCAGALVRLFPADYDPVKNSADIQTDTTDMLGNYAFFPVPRGNYTVLATHEKRGTRAIVHDIRVDNDTFITPARTLSAPGSIKAFLPAGSDDGTGYVFIPGTSYHAFQNTQSEFVLLDSVTAGTVPRLSYSSLTGSATEIIRYNVPVGSSDTTVVWNPSWNYARVLTLNTSKSGANVPGDVVGFPVLIRLNTNNFEFIQAQAQGLDLRFAKPDNTMLPYEIERWDADLRNAEVWVKIDTVRGNDSTQAILMYWGNVSAAGSSNSTATFDTAAGFQGVWHLGDVPGDLIYDATVNRFNGDSPDSARPLSAEGAIGGCRTFNGVDDVITMPNTAKGKLNFPQKGKYTVSAWVTAETFDGLSHVVVSKGNFQYFLWVTPIHLNATLWEFAEYQNGTGWDLSVQKANARQWVLLTGVRDGATQRLYVNGEPLDSLIGFPYSSARNDGSDIQLGRFHERMASWGDIEGYCPFKGKIDEVRVSNVARNASWIRLCYMNQKTDDKLIIFK